MDDTAAYWNYEYQVPAQCNRVNCSLSDLPDLETDFPDVQTVGWNGNDTYYGISIRYQCKTFGMAFQDSAGEFFEAITITCQANKTWDITELQPCEWYACVNPATPDESTNLRVHWDPFLPPKIDEYVEYVCNTTGYNWLENAEFNSSFFVKCLPDNQFEDVVFPTCVNETRCDFAAIDTSTTVISMDAVDSDLVSYKDTVRWTCKDRRYSPKVIGSSDTPQEFINGTCGWNTRFSVTPADLECVLLYCVNATTEPLQDATNYTRIVFRNDKNKYTIAGGWKKKNVNSSWVNGPFIERVKLGDSVKYVCTNGLKQRQNTAFKYDARDYVKVKCEENGEFGYEDPWPPCLNDIVCPDPGTSSLLSREDKDGEYDVYPHYKSESIYKCIDRRRYVKHGEELHPQVKSKCYWREAFNILAADLDCQIHHCGHPHVGDGSHPPPPPEYNITLVESNETRADHVPFGTILTYRCEENTYIENREVDPTQTEFSVECVDQEGVYRVPDVWPNCTDTVTCGPSLEASLNGSRVYLDPTRGDNYNSTVRYYCVNGSQFDTNLDGKGDSIYVDIRCQWDKNWKPFDSLPQCKITHCVEPYDIPEDSNLREVTARWTEVGRSKQYECEGKTAEGLHTMYFEADRSKSTFSMYCREDGMFELENVRENWPTCLQDIECDEMPPEIPTDPEYVHQKDDGWVHMRYYEYPLPEGPVLRNVTAEYNRTSILRNFDAQLVYGCGMAREFKEEDGTYHPIQTMTCHWDRQWTPTHLLPECDWVACLRPPEPPKETNLMITDWFGEIIPFGGKARYVCKRGMYFEEDSKMEDVVYECQDGTEKNTKRGFFNVPRDPSNWPRCLAAPVCPTPPDIPLEGTVTNKPKVVKQEKENLCALDGEDIKIKCHSFLDIYVTNAFFGRQNEMKKRMLCQGQKDDDPKGGPADSCVNEDIIDDIKTSCHGQFECELNYESDAYPLTGCDGMRREVNISYICVDCEPWYSTVDTVDCVNQTLQVNGWISEEEMQTLSDDDKSSLLRIKINKKLNGTFHSILDLGSRKVMEEQGGLCGLGSLYWALSSTIVTKSELTKLDYQKMRDAMFTEMSVPPDPDMLDKELLETFHSYVCGSKTYRRRREDDLQYYYSLTSSSAMQRTRRQAETEEELERRLYGAKLTYKCGLARKFQDPDTEALYEERTIQCNWNRTWTLVDYLDPCVWVQCLYHPEPPAESGMVSNWDGRPVEFGSSVNFSCADETTRYEHDNLADLYEIECFTNGSYFTPEPWPVCVNSVNCTDPPARPGVGTWEWNGGYEYGNRIKYTCGPIGKFCAEEDGGKVGCVDELVAECSWNKSWTPAVLPSCSATHCSRIPFPPRKIGLVYTPDAVNNLTLESEFSKYDPTLPYQLNFPGPGQCDEGKHLLITGIIPATSKQDAEFVFYGSSEDDEGFHIQIAPGSDTVYRWSKLQGEKGQVEGQPKDGTSIDYDEPFTIRIKCDEDGWALRINKDPQYPHFMHVMPVENITAFQILGDLVVSYVGFVPEDLQPAPPLGFNLTFMCPEGMVFDHDWLATPFIMMTCQDSGVFDEPDWDSYKCVLPTTTECFDCTTTTTTTTTTDVPTTMPPDEMLYPKSADYHWDRFDKNVSRRDIVGGWTMKGGFGQGPFGFGSAVKFSEGQCMYDKDWMKADEENGLANDPCMINPLNCTEGISFNIWEKMSFDGNIITVGGVAKKYLMSTGGDFNSVNGKAWPGFAIYHQGVDIVGMVSTGDRVWALSVSGQLYNNTWTQIGLRFVLPNLANPRLATQGVRGLEKMGGLEMFINMEKVGHSVLPEATDRGSTQWKPQPRLSDDGTETGQPLIMFGCHQNADMKLKDEFTGFAGTEDSPALIDEAAIWRHRLPNLELDFFYGGFSPEFENINADQFGAMLGGVDLADPEQAAAAQAVLEAMLLGPPTTLPPFPTRTPKPTTKLPTTLSEEELAAITTTTTAKPVETGATLRKGILSKQNIMTSMLGTSAAREGQDPEYVEGRFSMAVVASALLTGDEENVKKWRAVEEEPEHEGPQKTVRELEEYMLAWVGSVNISADREDEHNWRTSYFDPESDSMRYATKAKDMVMNVDKIPLQPIRDNEQIRLSYPDYDGWEWAEAKAQWNNVRDNFTVPTGMFEKIEGCKEKPVTILTAVYNGLTYISPMRRNPVNIRSHKTKLDSKVISVRAKLNADPIEGDVTKVYQCRPDPEYMKWNPVRLTFWHNEAAKAKRTLLWHSEEYWEGLEVRHCVWWNERLGFNGAWDDHGCTLTKTDDAKTDCECSNFGSYAVLAELLEAPEDASLEQWLLILKWIGIIIGTCLLTVFIATVFLSVVVGEMFHQIRMWCCLSYMIANIFMLLSDTGLCDGRHSNLAFSMALMFFYQAALVWNMCETHATFKGVTSGLINGRTSVYHPISWGAPLFCLGFITFLEGDVMGTHPNCFISWEKNPIKIYFAFNLVCFAFTILFSVIVAFNLMRVQSHNKDTVMYLKDQVKGMFATSLCMIILWSYGTVGYFAYMKTKDMEVVNLMPAFQVLNGWFGVIMFFLLGIWSKRFRIGLSSQAEEKKNRLNAMKQKYEEGRNDDAPSTAETSPISTRPSSAAGSPLASSRPASSQSNRPASSQSNRPASSMSQTASRPASSTSKAPSRPATSVSKGTSRPSTSTSKGPSRPGSGVNDESME